jgi:hypothetical protein
LIPVLPQIGFGCSGNKNGLSRMKTKNLIKEVIEARKFFKIFLNAIFFEESN